MNNFKSLRITLIGGLIIGLGCAAFFYLVFKSGLVPPPVRFFDFWIPLVVVAFMMILLRGLKPGQPFHFWEGLIAGNLMCWIGGLVSGVTLWQLAKIDPVFFTNFLDSSIKYLKISNSSYAKNLQITDLTPIIKEFKNTDPSYFVLNEIRNKVIYSIVIVPLISMIFRRK